MKIEYLADHPEHTETVARWNFTEWGYLYDRSSFEGFLCGTRSNMNRQEIPCTLIALDSCGLLGSVSLLKEENEERRDLSPWLSSMYVEPESRGLGVGKALNHAVVSLAFGFGFSHVFLEALAQHVTFYGYLGWVEIDQCKYRDQSVTIMQIESKPQSGSEGD